MVRRFSVNAMVGTGGLAGVEGLEPIRRPDIIDRGRAENSSTSSSPASFSNFLLNLKGITLFFCMIPSLLNFTLRNT